MSKRNVVYMTPQAYKMYRLIRTIKSLTSTLFKKCMKLINSVLPVSVLTMFILISMSMFLRACDIEYKMQQDRSAQFQAFNGDQNVRK